MVFTSHVSLSSLFAGRLEEVKECARDHCGGGNPVDCVYGEWKEHLGEDRVPGGVGVGRYSSRGELTSSTRSKG